MLNKLRPYLCWNSVAHQNAIGKQDENIQQGDDTRKLGAINLVSDSDVTYLPREQVCYQKLSLANRCYCYIFSEIILHY